MHRLTIRLVAALYRQISGDEGMMKREEIKRFLCEDVVTTAEAANMLGCTRQYIYKLVKGGKLDPVKNMDRDRLFLKQDILDRIKE